MYKKLAVVIVCYFFNLFTFANANVNENFIAPSGIEKEAILAECVNIKTATIGQRIEAILLDDFKYSDKTIVPKDSVVIGSIVSYHKAEKVNEESWLQIKFTTIRTPHNNIIPISAIIKTDDEKGIIKSINKQSELVLQSEEKIVLLFTQPITLSAQ